MLIFLTFGNMCRNREKVFTFFDEQEPYGVVPTIYFLAINSNDDPDKSTMFMLMKLEGTAQ